MRLQLRKMSPSQILLLSFGLAIIIGAILLMLPFCEGVNGRTTWIVALYTSTSAICVTGLSIVDIGKQFSYVGQIVILILIQLGGIGIITFSSLIMLMVGKRITYGERQILKEGLNRENVGGVIKFVKKVILIILSIELIGSVILIIPFYDRFGFTFKTFFYAVFHSVSAFCNAGFSPFTDNLIGFRGDFVINAVIPLLIILGGIGFAVVEEIIDLLRGKKVKTSLNSKIVIKMYIWLVVVGSILIFVLEFDNVKTFAHFGYFEKIQTAVFQCVSSRTAGFSTIPLTEFKPATIFLIMIFMFIGAAPGSAGGGVKVTTFAVILFTVSSIIKNKKDVNMGNRRISWDIINRAFTILSISVMYIFAATFVIVTYENKEFIKVLFEVISAFGTVGMSLDFSTQLSDFSKMIIIASMFFGRVGLLTVVLALGEKLKVEKHRFPKENISVG